MSMPNLSDCCLLEPWEETCVDLPDAVIKAVMELNPEEQHWSERIQSILPQD